MKSIETVQRAFDLCAEGWSQRAIAEELEVGTSTVSRWLSAKAAALTPARVLKNTDRCPTACPLRQAVGPDYAYLLGQYLGDGWIGSNWPRRVHRLSIACCAAYPNIVDECERAIVAVVPTNRVSRSCRAGMIELLCYSKHWPCLMPQLGAGVKHDRPIVLESWQRDVVIERFPGRFVRGLIHSDGWRGTNRTRGAKGKIYSYTRYQFSNHSDDILQLFAEACEQLGVETKRTSRHCVSVSKRADVARLDAFVGAKT